MTDGVGNKGGAVTNRNNLTLSLWKIPSKEISYLLFACWHWFSYNFLYASYCKGGDLLKSGLIV